MQSNNIAKMVESIKKDYLSFTNEEKDHISNTLGWTVFCLEHYYDGNPTFTEFETTRKTLENIKSSEEKIAKIIGKLRALPYSNPVNKSVLYELYIFMIEDGAENRKLKELYRKSQLSTKERIK